LLISGLQKFVTTVLLHRHVTEFVFAFNNVRILTTFQLFDILRRAGSISVECEYFILLIMIEFY